MPASAMGAAQPNNAFVIMNPFSGPTGSPFDNDEAGNLSTGALCTGIGFGANHLISPTAPQSIIDGGFTDDYTPGTTLPGGTAATTAILTCIGGGKSTAAVDGIAPTVPYNVQPLLGFGNGGSRNAGAGPIFTGFATKTVTATGSVANGAAIETGWTNRTGTTMITGQSAFGSSTAASAAIT